MRNQTKTSFKPGSKVWVWDSTWLPAVVIGRGPIDRILVRFEHGVTFPVTMENLCCVKPLDNPRGLSRDDAQDLHEHSMWRSVTAERARRLTAPR